MTESPNPGFQQIVIVGLGLIGGSLALDLRRLHLAEHLLGYDQRPHHCEEALHRNLVDSASTNFDEKLHNDYLSSEEAESLAGKLSWAQQVLFQRLGRAYLHPLYARGCPNNWVGAV